MSAPVATIPLCGELAEPVRSAVEQHRTVLVVSLRLKPGAGSTGSLLVARRAMELLA